MFCASQASTAICMSMDQPSSSSAAGSLGGRAIDRHNPIIRDSRRFTRTLPTINPCTSQPPPINPTPYHLLVNNKKSSSASKPSHQTKKKKKKKNAGTASESNDIADGNKSSVVAKDKNVVSGRKSSADRSQLIDHLLTPPGSSRYLLGDAAFFDGIKDYGPVLDLVPVEDKKKKNAGAINGGRDQPADPKFSSSSQPDKPKTDQVVVLRVSLHCKGCEGKVRKHLSRMEGVTSFNIDFKEKKVTIIGDVTPLGVLASVSKVKNCQFWTAAAVTSPYATPSLASTSAKYNI